MCGGYNETEATARDERAYEAAIPADLSPGPVSPVAQSRFTAIPLAARIAMLALFRCGRLRCAPWDHRPVRPASALCR
jgi:hypothetical protein